VTGRDRVPLSSSEWTDWQALGLVRAKQHEMARKAAERDAKIKAKRR